MITTFLLCNFSEWREIGTQNVTTQKTSVTNIFSRYVNFWNTINCMWLLMDESKLQFDEKKNKNWNTWKFLKMYIKKLGLNAINWLIRVTSLIKSSLTSLRHLSAFFGHIKKRIFHLKFYYVLFIFNNNGILLF